MLELTLDIGAHYATVLDVSDDQQGAGSTGTRTVCFDDREELLSPGDAVDVAPRKAHQLRNDLGEPLGGVEARICDEPKRVGQRYAAGAS
jgi:hypothetical protein